MVPPTVEGMERITQLPFPVCASVAEGSVNGGLTVEERAEMGFRPVVFPQSLIRAWMKAMYVVLQETGSTKARRGRACSRKDRAGNNAIEEYTGFKTLIKVRGLHVSK